MELLTNQFIFSNNVSKLFNWLIGNGYKFTIGEVFRTQEQQNLYYKRGLTKVKYSRHQDRLAIDLNIFLNGKELSKKEDFKQVAIFWGSLNPKNECGYFWNWDLNHFEMKT